MAASALARTDRIPPQSFPIRGEPPLPWDAGAAVDEVYTVRPTPLVEARQRKAIGEILCDMLIAAAAGLEATTPPCAGGHHG